MYILYRILWHYSSFSGYHIFAFIITSAAYFISIHLFFSPFPAIMFPLMIMRYASRASTLWLHLFIHQMVSWLMEEAILARMLSVYMFLQCHLPFLSSLRRSSPPPGFQLRDLVPYDGEVLSQVPDEPSHLVGDVAGGRTALHDGGRGGCH